MKIAIPTADGLLCAHFGQCRQFTVIDVSAGEITATETVTPPPHDRGVFPAWLGQQGCTHVIAGGMGQRARLLFEQNGIAVICGASEVEPSQAVRDLLANTLAVDSNPCDDPGFRREAHGDGHGHCKHKD